MKDSYAGKDTSKHLATFVVLQALSLNVQDNLRHRSIGKPYICDYRELSPIHTMQTCISLSLAQRCSVDRKYTQYRDAEKRHQEDSGTIN